MFRTVPLSIVRNFFTAHTAMVYVIQVLLTACEQDQDRTGLVLLLYDTHHCCVYSENLLIVDRGTVRNM